MTTTAAEESLHEQVRRGATEAKQSAAEVMAGLAKVADELDMAETSAKLRETEGRLRSDTFNLIVMGRFKNGKSTLLNALMGGTTRPVDLGGQKGPMVVDDLPATATLTAVHYAEEPYVKAWSFDGKSERWSFSRYLNESTLDVDEEESRRRLSHIRQFEMGFPARLCQAGVTVFDSPGLDDIPARTAITREATRGCDAAVIVYRSDALMGHNELMDAASLVVEGTRVFNVVNLWDKKQVDDKLRAYVWNKYVRDYLGGPKWEGQDLAERDIYFVNAGQARDARYGVAGADVAATGLIEFERALGDFLVHQRQQVHLSRFTTQATALGDAIDKHIVQRRRAIEADQEDLRRAYTEILPQLSAIRERPNRLDKLFDRYRREAEDDLVASFQANVGRIRTELPGHLEATPLPTAAKFMKVMRQKQLQKEAAEVVSGFVTERINQWAEREASPLLQGIVERLNGEIESEIATISRRYDEINFDLTGWSMEARADGQVVSTSERVLSATAGLLIGDVSAAVTGGAGGVQGAIGGIGGAMGSTFILGALGVTSAAVLLPVTLAAAFVLGAVVGGKGFEKRVKDTVCRQTDPMLSTLAEETTPQIISRLDAAFAELQSTVTQEISAVIDEEERNITKLVELNQRNQAEREHMLAQLGATATAVVEHRAQLAQALAIAKQV